MTYEIEYGKAEVTVYRTYPAPLRVTPIPESPFTGSDMSLFAVAVDVTVLGEQFLPAYTHGDNTLVVATDSMKNLIHRLALEHDGATLESFAAFVGTRFLEGYTQMERVRVACREIAFESCGGVLLSRSRDEAASCEVELARDGGRPHVKSARSARVDLRLVKLTGSSFERFVRDEFTTLAETVDRPLFIHCDVGWRYSDVADAVGPRTDRYVHAQQVRDLVRHTFADMDSRSIQHLVHEMAARVLARWPQLLEVSFTAQNRTWDALATSERDARVKVYTDARGTYGRIGLVLRR